MTRSVRFLILVSLLVLGSTPMMAQSAQEDELQQLRVDVTYLSSDLLGGRATGTEGEALAAQYIATRFEAIGLEPGGVEGWYQPFSFTHLPHPHATEGDEKHGRNVIGVLDRGAEQTVVIGAHYDHLGLGVVGSRAPGEEAIHNGADDNASGVAGILEIAQRVIEEGGDGQNLVVVAFSGEEFGLFGSKHYAQAPPVMVGRFNYMINLDMVGRLNEENVLVLNGVGTAEEWPAAIEAANQFDLDIKTHASGVGASDHTSFYLQDIPVLHFFTGQHQEYHKPTDDAPLINFQGLKTVADFATELILGLEDDGPLTFLETNQAEERTAARFTVSLGVMPDYVGEAEGVRFDAVLDDRPAAKAGLEKGDILIEMDGTKIKDVYTYMEVLSRFKEGDSTEVVVKRGEEEVRAKVTF